MVRAMGKRAGALGMEQRGMGNGQQLMKGQRSSMGNGQQQQGMDARQLGRQMGSQQLWEWNGSSTSTVNERDAAARSSATKQDPCAEWGRASSMSRFHGALTNQQQNTGLDPKQQPQKLNAPGPFISFHYPPQDSHGTLRNRTACTGFI